MFAGYDNMTRFSMVGNSSYCLPDFELNEFSQHSSPIDSQFGNKSSRVVDHTRNVLVGTVPWVWSGCSHNYVERLIVRSSCLWPQHLPPARQSTRSIQTSTTVPRQAPSSSPVTARHFQRYQIITEIFLRITNFCEL